jgi:rhodanese-related sulfurtransferase
LIKTSSVNILDVRKEGEYKSEHVKDAENLPLDFINENFTNLDPDRTYYVHCAGGYRSMIFCSILKARGFESLVDVNGGLKSIKENKGIPVTNYVCPSTVKSNK